MSESQGTDQPGYRPNAEAWGEANRREGARRAQTQQDMGNLAGPKTQRPAPAKEES